MRNVIARLQILSYGLAVGIGLAAGASATAQEAGPLPPDDMEPPPAALQPKMNVDKEVSKMAKRYALSNDQKAQIRVILSDEKQKTDAVLQDSSLMPEERFSKMRTIHEDEVSRVTTILTVDQQVKYERDEKQMAAHQGDDSADGPPRPPSGDQSGVPPPPQGS